MANMDPVNGKLFKLGSGNMTTPGTPAPDFDFNPSSHSDVVLFLTLDKYGALTIWNHPSTPATEKVVDHGIGQPYNTQVLYDLTTITLVIYSDDKDPNIVEVGGWSLGPPPKMYT